MGSEHWAAVILGLLGLGVTITLSLIGIIFSWLRTRVDRTEEKLSADIRELDRKITERLRTLGHEDREIRSMIDGLKTLMIEHVSKRDHGK